MRERGKGETEGNDSDDDETTNLGEPEMMNEAELRWIMQTMFNVEQFDTTSSPEDSDVNLHEHFGWQGLTHDDDVADLSSTEITEQGLNVNLRRVNY